MQSKSNTIIAVLISLIVILSIVNVNFYILVQENIDHSYQEICEYSQYSTKEYQRIQESLYCRSSKDSFQKLVKPADKSKVHLSPRKLDKGQIDN